MRRLLLTLLIRFAPLVEANSSSPDCRADQSSRFHNCFGTFSLADESEYVGEYKDGKQHGQGTATFPDRFTWKGYFMNDEYVPNIYTDMGLTKGSRERGQCVLNLMGSAMSEED